MSRAIGSVVRVACIRCAAEGPRANINGIARFCPNCGKDWDRAKNRLESEVQQYNG